MIQDIYPSKLDTAYYDHEIRDTDALLVFDGDGRLLAGEKDGVMVFLPGKDLGGGKAVYLFSLDETRFFLKTEGPDPCRDGFVYYSNRDIREKFSGKEVFAAFTAYHLWKWYDANRFCGKCGHRLVIDPKERTLRCHECGNSVYPRINPAVIVGVTKGDHILITRYTRGGYNALVAGFSEIGETLEETVAREVMEETGVSVKNIRYYKSQPWGMAQDLLVGFYCDADGDGEIRMDGNELKYAAWVKREDVELQPNNLSLTNEMMRMFKEDRLR